MKLLAIFALAPVLSAQQHPGLPSGQPNRHYIGNRAPLKPLALTRLPAAAVRPEGWLREQLVRMTNGFSGRLPELSKFCQYEGNAWTDPTGKGRFGWEELPYWLKGYIDLGYVLNDRRIIDESTRWVEAVLRTQRSDGYFGSTTNLDGDNTLERHGMLDIWPNMVMLYVLRTHYEATGDPRILPFITRYFAWLHRQPLADILPGSWQKFRGGDNLDSVYWLYNRSGDPWLLDLARVNHERTADWVGSIPTWHGVNVSECFREPAEYYQQTLDERYLDSTRRVYSTVMRLYGQAPGGGFASDENARPGFNGPRQGVETCTWVEFMHSHELLAAITGDAVWADRAEEIAFNSLPASMTPDLKALHYLTAPNQIQLDRANKAPLLDNSGDMFAYDPYGFRCCQHNAAMGWPYYAERLWMATADNGLAAVFYAASSVKAKVAGGDEVTITETTDYPFDTRVRFSLSLARPARFPIALRIPAWCKSPRISINGENPAAVKSENGWATIDRTWHNADSLVLALPMQLTTKRWELQKNAASVYYGPLAFSLKIGEDWRPFGDNPEWRKYEVFPSTPWNYALDLDHPLTLVEKSGPLAAQPFTPADIPLSVRAKGRRVPEWRQESNGLVGEIQQSPVKTEAPLEDITLIPMGAARLRITVFPVAGGAGAEAWDPNPGYLVASSASHLESPSAPGFSFDGKRNSTEWIEIRYAAPKQLRWSEVEWASGAAPESSRLLYWTGKAWRELKTRGDARVSFGRVSTTRLRLEIKTPRRQAVSLTRWKVGA